MPTIFTSLPGQPIATLTASHLLATSPPDALAETLLLVPTRRSCGLLRRAFLDLSGGKALRLPRITALADLETEMPSMLDAAALAELAAIPPAMPPWQRLSLLTKQVLAFEAKRRSDPPLEHALSLAQDLAKLQDQCALHEVTLSSRKLAMFAEGDDALHWQQPIEFLGIIGDHWPQIETALGLTIAATRQTRIQQLATRYWREHPPATPVMVIGSTASLATTAALMQAIADAQHGAVLLPGLDPRMAPDEWSAVAEGHPYFHLKQFLARWPLELAEVQLLASDTPPYIWLPALTPTSRVEHWHDATVDTQQIQQLKLIACASDEEEVRVVTVLIREALEQAEKRIALVTPDEGFMDRVAAQLQRYGVVADRLSRGRLANTATGNLWLTLTNVINEPSRMLAQLALLRHPLVMQESAAEWQSWLDRAERYFRGLMSQRDGHMPCMPEPLQIEESYGIASAAIRAIASLSREKLLASEWIARLETLLQSLQASVGEGAEAVADALEALAATDDLGRIRIESFLALLTQALSEPWRGGLVNAHPNVLMLTPIEARMQQFDRVILANLRDTLWPGIQQSGPWLNFTHQQKLGLPKPEESISLMAHDLLVLGSGGEIFLTHARREAGSPVARSRFVERLVTLLAVQGIDESTLHAPHYREWAASLDAATHYTPETEAKPTPTAAERTQEINVSALDALFTDPYRIYAEYILKLKPVDEFDTLPEARDFGTIAHRAIERLSQHWTEKARPATAEELTTITDHALRAFSERPNIRLFWHRRLHAALEFVNGREAERRGDLRNVTNEVPIKQSLAFGKHALTLRGRIDRLEEHTDGTLTIGDYKTGAPPKPAEIINGKAVQLLAYALILSTDLSSRLHAGIHRGESSPKDFLTIDPDPGAAQEQAGMTTSDVSLDYWGLPSGKREGAVKGLDAAAIAPHHMLDQHRTAPGDFMTPETPLLAKPAGGNERFQNPYDGISRYDEWAE